ncbi:MAG: 3-hydroxybutyrate dehydrogenase [Terriglobia bacterium]|jgi:3-hydroxybutyrate dehydrogenase
MVTNALELEKPRPLVGDQLKGRIAIVTGAGSGIGKAIAEALACEGVTVVVNDIDTESGMAVTQGINGSGGEAVFRFGDVSDVKDVMGLIRTTVDRYTRIDILVNNAGLQHIAPIPEFTEEKWNQLIGVMLTGPFLTTKYAFPHMMAQRKGRIINIASTQSLVSAEFKAAYVSAKHGVLGLTKVTALEGAPHNITAVAVCPCFVRTPLAEKQIAGQAKFHGLTEQEVVEKIMMAPAALHRLLEPEEVAALVVYLATDVAQCITGSAVPIDCGWTAR